MPLLGTYAVAWYICHCLVCMPLFGTYAVAWYICPYLVHMPLLGTYAVAWYICRCLVHMPLLGTYVIAWYISPYLVHMSLLSARCCRPITPVSRTFVEYHTIVSIQIKSYIAYRLDRITELCFFYKIKVQSKFN